MKRYGLLGLIILCLVLPAPCLIDAQDDIPPGWIVFTGSARYDGVNIYRVRPDGSDLQRVTTGRGEDYFPVWSPDGQSIAFYSEETGSDEVFVVNADGSDQHQVSQGGGYGPSWSPDGEWIAYTCTEGLCVVRRDGSESHVISGDSGAGFPHWSPDGEWIAYLKPRSKRGDDFWVFGRMRSDGADMQDFSREDGIDAYDNPGLAFCVYGQPCMNWSPDSQYLVISGNEAYDGLSMINIQDNTIQRLPGLGTYPVWSPDGEWIAFVGQFEDTHESCIYRIRPDGTDLQRLTEEIRLQGSFASWSPDSAWIVFGAVQTVDGRDQTVIYIMRSDGSDLREVPTGDLREVAFPAWSTQP